MTLTQKQGEELFRKVTFHRFFKHICEHCNEQLVVDLDDCKLVLFEPKEVEEEYMTFGDKKMERHTHMVMRSSDPTKDIYKFVCPVCGELIMVNAKELTKNYCSIDGEQHRIFTLNSNEVKEADEFIKQHNHTEEFLKEKQSPFFSTLGQQFSYEFIPGGLGDSIVIKCNHCGETKEITDIENW